MFKFNRLKAFLSHRYGSITLPTRIIKEEYDLFAKYIEANKDHIDLAFHYEHIQDDALGHETKTPNVDIQNLFAECYELDENEIPARYKLKHLDRLLPDFEDKVSS